MNFTEALSEIGNFWTESKFPFAGGSEARLRLIETEFGHTFPTDVCQYIGAVISPRRFVFSSVGNPIDVYGFDDLAKRANGYNFNPVTQSVIAGWSDDWLLLADEGADPIIVDLGHSGDAPPVLQAMHEAGEWNFCPIAASLPQFILLSAARHHALMMLDANHRIIEDKHGLNLGAPAAEWLFPRVQQWAPEFYHEWVGAFANARITRDVDQRNLNGK